MTETKGVQTFVASSLPPSPTSTTAASTCWRAKYRKAKAVVISKKVKLGIALITGRNHHSAGFGVISEAATGYPGYNSIITKDKATIGEILKANGYATSWYGKNHNTPSFVTSQAGPFDQWPVGMGFEYFYGFNSGETNQWQPDLYRNTTRIYPYLNNPNYNLTTDMADEAVSYLNQLNELDPKKPFLLYYAPGGTHAPHHPTPEWIEKFKGKFSMGWNALREQIFANQKKLGVIPQDAQLTPWPSDILKNWDDLSSEEKKLFERQMEVYAAYLAYTDHEIGRVVQAIEDMGKLDNTLIIYISGDNGASAEGTLNGTPNEVAPLNGVTIPLKDQFLWYEFWGSDKTYPHMAVEWAWAFDTPFQWTKQVASHFGGTRQGMAISWPARIKDVGGLRHQFHHVIDIAPTVLEAAGLPEPTMVNGTRQRPMDGVSMLYTFDEPKAKDRRTTQYFEMFGNRAIYHDGWVAATRHSIPWLMVELPPFDKDRWELYHVAEDFSQANDLAAQHPQKLKELQDMFVKEAIRNHVFPLDDRRSERFDARIAGRPDLVGARTSLTLYEGMTGITENAFINVKGRSHTITADVEVPPDGADGVIIAQAGRFGGWSLYMKDGRVHEVYNFGGLERFTVSSPQPLGPGRHTIRYDFICDGGKPGSGGLSRLSVDGQKVG